MAAGKTIAEVKVMLQCGAVRPLLPDLIDAGLDAINPSRSVAGAWKPKVWTFRIGTHVLGWRLRHAEDLPSGTPAEIRERVARQLRIVAHKVKIFMRRGIIPEQAAQTLPAFNVTGGHPQHRSAPGRAGHFPSPDGCARVEVRNVLVQRPPE